MEFGDIPCLMAILNVTPDSFSDGGRFFDPRAAIEQAHRLVAQGADILDIGGESTRPYSECVAADEELRRVMPVIEAIAGRVPVPISIDTSKAIVAREAIMAGAEIVNDVRAGMGDPAMVDVVIETGVGICAMHMQGTPQTMQDCPRYDDVVSDVLGYLRARRDALVARGVDVTRICLDPGIGFGKKTGHNLALLNGIGRFHELGCPLLVGHSRKGFIGEVLGDRTIDRDAGGIGVALAAARHGVQVLRMHDVEKVRQALRLFEACGGMDGSHHPADQDSSRPVTRRDCD